MSRTPAKTAEANTKAYLRTKVMTASPAELRMMLFDGALRFAEKGRAGLAERDFEAAYEGISRCQQILLELINGLQPEQDPALCERLSGLYTFMYTRLIDASQE
ncbi:MAG: flagellar export chaperone FliS, partial [Planctomycetota bacterium]